MANWRWHQDPCWYSGWFICTPRVASCGLSTRFANSWKTPVCSRNALRCREKGIYNTLFATWCSLCPHYGADAFFCLHNSFFSLVWATRILTFVGMLLGIVACLGSQSVHSETFVTIYTPWFHTNHLLTLASIPHGHIMTKVNGSI